MIPTIAKIASKRTVAQTNDTDEQNGGKDRDEVLRVRKDHRITEELRTESSAISVPTRDLSSKKRTIIPPAAIRPINSSKASIADLASSVDDVIKQAKKRLLLPSLPSRCEGIPHEPVRLKAPEQAGFFRAHAPSNLAKRHCPDKPETVSVVDRLMNGSSDGNASVKRRKADIDELRAELAEERRVMEESKRQVDELRRKTEERQVGLFRMRAVMNVW